MINNETILNQSRLQRCAFTSSEFEWDFGKLHKTCTVRINVILRRVLAITCGKAVHITYCECVCSLSYPARNAHAPYLWPVPFYIFPHYLENGMIFGKKNLLTYLLTPWSRVLLEKLTGSVASQGIPRIFGTRKFLTVPTSARLSLSWANSIQSSQPTPTSWNPS